MVCSVYQWSAESTKVIEPLKICVRNCDGLLSHGRFQMIFQKSNVYFGEQQSILKLSYFLKLIVLIRFEEERGSWDRTRDPKV